jgi:hypothetical protein
MEGELSKMYCLTYFETIITHQGSGKLEPARTGNGRFNVMWGKDYQLMDGGSFIGGITGENYERIIDLMLKIKEAEI